MQYWLKGIICLILVIVIPFWFPSVGSSFDEFPIGLELTYHVKQGAYTEWIEEYTILNCAPEINENVVYIALNSTQSQAENATLLVDTISWHILFDNGLPTGSQLPVPLWIDSTTWHSGSIIQLPTHSNDYQIYLDHIQVSLGTYTCWHASSVTWVSLDDDYQISDENWYFDVFQGVLIKHITELIPSQHVIYTYSFTRELVASNVHRFGVMSLEEQNQLTIPIPILVLLVCIVTVTIGYFGLQRYWREAKEG